ncbi:hypothetical protein Tco_1017678 [Tanacetum coccineum]|uniref:Uncharacterized protein n=1 Tax=Tanacetum coccineum TaxID=301880 RepID=A0ABQ5FTJ8_9ASTR
MPIKISTEIGMRRRKREREKKKKGRKEGRGGKRRGRERRGEGEEGVKERERGKRKFNSIKDAKSLLQAVEKRFGGNSATKKTQRNLLKQQYENFTAYSSEKFLRSLSPEWNTHTIVWRNKPEIDTLSLDDLYNNLKIYEPEVKGTSSSSSNIQNVAFVSLNSTSSTNGAVNTAHGATTTSTQATSINSTKTTNLIVILRLVESASHQTQTKIPTILRN